MTPELVPWLPHTYTQPQKQQPKNILTRIIQKYFMQNSKGSQTLLISTQEIIYTVAVAFYKLKFQSI